MASPMLHSRREEANKDVDIPERKLDSKGKTGHSVLLKWNSSGCLSIVVRLQWGEDELRQYLTLRSNTN